VGADLEMMDVAAINTPFGTSARRARGTAGLPAAVAHPIDEEQPRELVGAALAAHHVAHRVVVLEHLDVGVVLTDALA
jgi:hypothetical protein